MQYLTPPAPPQTTEPRLQRYASKLSTGIVAGMNQLAADPLLGLSRVMENVSNTVPDVVLKEHHLRRTRIKMQGLVDALTDTHKGLDVLAEVGPSKIERLYAQLDTTFDLVKALQTGGSEAET